MGRRSAPTRGGCTPRMQEVFAGFLTHTDAQIGRVLDALARDGRARQHDRDADLRQRRQRRGRAARHAQRAPLHRARCPRRSRATSRCTTSWGGFRAYPHYSWGWAWAGNTPLRLWKRYTWLGGTRTPLIVHWPGRHRGGRARSASQFCHAIDLMPTILDACGVDAPDVVDGVTQQPVDGASLAADLRRPRRAEPARRRSTSRCSARARSSAAGGRRRPTTCRRAWPTRSA